MTEKGPGVLECDVNGLGVIERDLNELIMHEFSWIGMSLDIGPQSQARAHGAAELGLDAGATELSVGAGAAQLRVSAGATELSMGTGGHRVG